MKIAQMPRQFIVALGFTTLFSTAVQADDYRVQVDLDALKSDADLRTKQDNYGLRATVYLGRVATVDTVIAESAFLNKSSSVSVNYIDSEVEQAGSKADGDGWGIATRYIANEKMIYDVSYSSNNIAGISDPSIDNPSWGLGVGYYIDDLTTFGVSYAQNDPDNNTGSAFKTLALNLKSITDVNGTNRASGEISLSVSQNAIANTILQLAGRFDYYFTPRFSVGGRLGLIGPNNGDDENIYGLQTRYFINNSLAVEAMFSTSIFQEDSDTASVDGTDTFSIKLTGRI